MAMCRNCLLKILSKMLTFHWPQLHQLWFCLPLPLSFILVILPTPTWIVDPVLPPNLNSLTIIDLPSQGGLRTPICVNVNHTYVNVNNLMIIGLVPAGRPDDTEPASTPAVSQGRGCNLGSRPLSRQHADSKIRIDNTSTPAVRPERGDDLGSGPLLGQLKWHRQTPSIPSNPSRGTQLGLQPSPWTVKVAPTTPSIPSDPGRRTRHTCLICH